MRGREVLSPGGARHHVVSGQARCVLALGRRARWPLERVPPTGIPGLIGEPCKGVRAPSSTDTLAAESHGQRCYE
jgi:hypothetical protein